MSRDRRLVAFAFALLLCVLSGARVAEAQCTPDEPVDCGDGTCCPDGLICCGGGDCEFQECSSSVGPTGGDPSGSSGVGGSSGSGGTPSCPVDCGDDTCCPSAYPICCSDGTCTDSPDGCTPAPGPDCVIACGAGVCCPASASYCCADGSCSSTPQCGSSIQLLCAPGYPIQCSDQEWCCPEAFPVCCPPFCGKSEGACEEPSFHAECNGNFPFLCDDGRCWTLPCNTGFKGGDAKTGDLPLDTTWTEAPADCSTRGAGSSGNASLLCAVAMIATLRARRRKKARSTW